MPNSKYSSLGQFMQKEFKWPKEAKFFNTTAILPLDDQRNAKVELTIHGGSGIPTSEHYIGLVVKIVHKQTGDIDTKHFPFNDYMKPTDRVDTRSDYKGRFEVISYCGSEWYICEPSKKARDSYMKEIVAYIDSWR